MSAPQVLQGLVRMVAFRILEQVLEGGGNSSQLLEKATFRSPEDRALGTELVLGLLRHLLPIDARIARVSSRPLARIDWHVLLALRLGAYQLTHLTRVPAYAAVGESVEIVKRVAGHKEASFVNGVLRALTRADAEGAVAARAGAGAEDALPSLPPFLRERWRQRFGEDAARRLAEAALRPPATALRVVRSRAQSPAAVIESLRWDGIEARPGKYLEEALVVERAAGLIATAAFRTGLVFVQDEAAQLVARLVAPAPGNRVLDACAAPGGKSLAIANLAARAGEAGAELAAGVTVVACERRPGRLKLLRANLERTRLPGVRPVVCDASAPALLGGFERVLVDAPCTGTGTIRKNPEIRWRVDSDAVARSAERARAILAGVVPLLAAGGRLVYATCSLEPEENDDVIAWLLAREPALARVDPRPSLPESAHALVGDDLVLRTQPADVDLDGFTAFVLGKSA